MRKKKRHLIQIYVRIYYIPVSNAVSFFNEYVSDVFLFYKTIEDFQECIGREKLIWKSALQLQVWLFKKHLRSIWGSNNQNIKKHWIHLVICCQLEATGIHCVYLFSIHGGNSTPTAGYYCFHLSNLYETIVIII